MKFLKSAQNWSKKNYDLNFAILTAFIVIFTAFSGISAIFHYNYTTTSGPSTIYTPTGYGIIRGMSGFPSDYLFVPLEWRNSGGKSLFIRQPFLILEKIPIKSGESDRIYFTMAGQSEKISSDSFNDINFDNTNTILLDPSGATYKILVFHKL